MDFENLTERSRGFIQSAQMLAMSKRHQTLLPEHLLKVILDDREGLAAGIIRKAGGEPQNALRAVESELDKIPQVYAQGSADQLHLSPEFVRLIGAAGDIAKKAGDSYVTVERLLQAFAAASGSKVQKAIAASGVSSDTLNKAIESMRGGRKADTASTEQGYDALKKYTRDLTQAAKEVQTGSRYRPR